MSGQRIPANGQDMSALDFDESAWDSNEMMRGPGEAEADPPEDDDDDLEQRDQVTQDLVEEPEGDDEQELEADDSDEDPDDEAQEGDEEEGEEEDDLGPIDPPSRWPAQEQQFFKQLPPALQHAYMARAQAMTADYTRKTQALSQERQYYQSIGQVIQPHLQHWAVNGMAPAQAIQQLIAIESWARQSPAEFIQYFANLRGVDLKQFAQPGEQEYLDPQVAALRQPLAEVYSQVNQLKQEFQQREQQAQQQQYRQSYNMTASAIDEFANRTDAQGQKLYPHFDHVVETMTAYVNGGVRDLDQAYRMACQATPQIASRLAARSQKSANEKRRREAEAARRASASITGSIPGNGSLNTENMSVGDTIRAAYRGDLQ